jgi:hypothetical protein
MEDASRALGRPDAAARVADLLQIDSYGNGDHKDTKDTKRSGNA